MRRKCKKIISTVCVITLVVGSLTFTNKQSVEAVGKTTATTFNKSLNQGINLLADEGTGTEAAVTNLRVASHKVNTVNVQWDYVSGTSYKIELLNDANEVKGTITDPVINENVATCQFTGVAEGTYTIRITATVDNITANPVISDSVQVYNKKADDIASLTYDVSTKYTISATWTVNNPIDGQTYNVYLDDTLVAESLSATSTDKKTGTYTFENLSAGFHRIKVTAQLDGIESNGVDREVIVKGEDTITKFETALTQVVTNQTQAVGDWTYLFPAQSSDSYVGIGSNGEFVAYMPTYANAAFDKVSYKISGLTIGKTYNYFYTVYTDVAGNNIPVTAEDGVNEGDAYELKEVTNDGAGLTVTKKFTARTTSMTLSYILGYVNNSATVKISKVQVEELKPTDVTISQITGGSKTVFINWDSEGAVSEQKYNVYLYNSNGDEVTFKKDLTTTEYAFTNIEPGNYKVKVTSTLNGVESAGSMSDDVEVVSVLTTDDSAVEGFQIKTNGTDSNIAFRTVCRGINVGRTITASDGNTYTVKKLGIIYALDPNQSGYRKNDALNTAYTILNPDNVTGQQYTYKGKIEYSGQNVTYGYLANEDAVIRNWNASDTDHTYYVVTMNGINPQVTNSIHVRAFIVAADSSGNETIIYAKKTASMSVAEVADYLYRNSKAQNYSGHKYLFENILSQITTTNPYFRNTGLPYGWDNNLFTPSNPTYTVSDGTLEN